MDGPFRWNHQKMFDRYLYDHFVKNNMHETAEVFRREAELTIEKITPSDAPDDFLHDWWLIFYETFSALQSKSPHHNEDPYNMAEDMMDLEQPSDSFSFKLPELNEQTIRELTSSADSGLTTGGNAMSSTRSPLGAGQTSECFMYSLSPQKLLPSTQVMHSPPGYLSDILVQGNGSSGLLDDIVAEGINCSAHADSRMTRTASNEGMASLGKSVALFQSCRRKRKSSASTSEVGGSGIPAAINFPSEISVSYPMYVENIIKMACSYANENKDEEKTSSSNSLSHHTSPDSGDLKVYPVAESCNGS